MGEKAQYILNTADRVKLIKDAIEKKRLRYGEGYCPCVSSKLHSPDTICPCKEYRETGMCHCGMYVS